MKTSKLLITAVVAAGLSIGVAAQAKEKKHDEETISKASVPAAVQKAADREAKGGKITRWEKEGADYEVVIEKGGKKWEAKFDANGKMLKKLHEEGKGKGEKGEKGEKD